MILSDLRSYLAEQRRASLIDMAHHFDADPEALRGMLTFLRHKGKVKKLPSSPHCGSGCDKCPDDSREIYAWIEPDPD